MNVMSPTVYLMAMMASASYSYAAAEPNLLSRQQQQAVGPGPTSGGASKTQVIIRFNNNDDASKTTPSFLPGTPRSQRIHPHLNIYVASLPPGISRSAALQKYQSRLDVVYAELDYELQTLLEPNDPLFVDGTSQWDMSIIDAELAWDIETDASDVVVAVIDTGIHFSHPDLVGNIYQEYPGFICIGGSGCVEDTNVDGSDGHGHGTQ